MSDISNDLLKEAHDDDHPSDEDGDDDGARQREAEGGREVRCQWK